MAKVSGGKKLEAYLASLAKKVKKRAVLHVGFPDNATYPDGTSLPTVAASNEYGNGRSPPRPFMRNAVKKNSDKWGKAIGPILVQNNYDAERALQILGAVVVGDIQQSILDTNSPPLKPATIRRKGHSKPLVDTGFMLKNVKSKVET